MYARYIYIFSNGSLGEVINIREFRVFGSKSLTKSATVFRSVPNDSNFPNLVASNLVTNIDNRSTSSLKTTYDRSGADLGTNFCYKIGVT